MALLMVVGAVAVAAVLGAAMLSAATMQNRASSNKNKSSAADYLAESGLNLAMYYLQYPERAPGYASNFGGAGYWTGTGGFIPISDSIAGQVSVSITPAMDTSVTPAAVLPWTYEVVCSGKSGSSDSSALTKTTGARVYVRNEYVVKHAAAFNGNTAMFPYVTVTGDVWSAGWFGLRRGTPTASVSGTAYCTFAHVSDASYFTVPRVGALPASNLPAPTCNQSSAAANSLNKYASYTIDDVTYYRQEITDSQLSNGSLPAAPPAGNPAGIYYRNGNLDINDGITINGTLIVEGTLKIKASGVTMAPAKSGFPALVVTDTLEVQQPATSALPARTLTVNGVCFVGNQVKSSGSIVGANVSRLTISGALLMGTTTAGTTAFTGSPSYNVITSISRDANKVKVPELTANYRVAKGVSIVRWGLP